MFNQKIILSLISTTLAFVLIGSVSCQTDQAEDDHHMNTIGWSYNDQEGWSEMYPECGDSENGGQSPINIVTDDVRIKPDYEVDFIDYDQQVEFQLKNNHHTISATPISATVPSLKLSWLGDMEFVLNEIHFHWGDGDVKGSEHEVNGQKAAAEMHMVHIRKGLKKDEIGNVDNSAVVIGVFIESDSVEHSVINSLIDDATNVNGTNSEFVTNDASHLINLLPSQHTFYTYNGSLTTPPCYEVVTWIMMSQPVFMNNERLIELSNLESVTEDGQRFKISANYRDLQPLGDRSVYASFRTEELVSPDLSKLQSTPSSPSAGGRFRSAFEEFWRRIESLRSTVRGKTTTPKPN